jgi:hypothetical protein
VNQPLLIPRQPKRLIQPRKSVLREQLRLAADEKIATQQRIETLEAEIQLLRKARWWTGFFPRRDR